MRIQLWDALAQCNRIAKDECPAADTFYLELLGSVVMRRLLLIFTLCASLAAPNTCLVWSPPVNVDAEIPVGIRDGKNHTFSLAHAPMNGSVPLVVVNGIVYRMGALQDFTIAANTLTFTTKAAVPQTPADNFLVWYRWLP